MTPLLPAVLWDWRGLFLLGGHAPERLAVLLNYQNVHLTAHDLFGAHGARPETTLVHPLLVAERITQKRCIQSDLVAVRVFRGRPNPEHHRLATAANDAQTVAWQQDPRVVVRRRDLSYRGWPVHPPREKGVNVVLAIDLVESAMLGEYDAAVVFTGDTDLLPAIEMAFRRTLPRIDLPPGRELPTRGGRARRRGWPCSTRRWRGWSPYGGRTRTRQPTCSPTCSRSTSTPASCGTR